MTWLPYDEALRLVRSSRRRKAIRAMQEKEAQNHRRRCDQVSAWHRRKKKRRAYEAPIVVQLAPYEDLIDPIREAHPR